MFQKLTSHDTFLRLVIWGEPGSGKTLFGLRAEHVALLDLENGADRYVGHLDFEAIKIEHFDQIEGALSFLQHQPHSYQTLVVDSASEAWGLCMRNMIEPDVKPDWIAIKGRWKNFLRQLRQLPMNIVLVGRAKDTKDETKWWLRTGMKEADLESSTCHDFDFVLFNWMSYSEEGGEPIYRTRIEKARDLSGKACAGMIFEDFSFPRFRALLTENRKEVVCSEPPSIQAPSNPALELLRSKLRKQLQQAGAGGQRAAAALCSQVVGHPVHTIGDLDEYDIHDVLDHLSLSTTVS